MGDDVRVTEEVEKSDQRPVGELTGRHPAGPERLLQRLFFGAAVGGAEGGG